MTVVDTTIPVHVQIAQVMGEDHGRCAAMWFFDGNTDIYTYQRFFKGIRDGDPEVLDELPQSNLSGEWADSYMPRDLYRDTGVAGSEAAEDEVFRAYEDAFCAAAESAIYAACKYQLDN